MIFKRCESEFRDSEPKNLGFGRFCCSPPNRLSKQTNVVLVVLSLFAIVLAALGQTTPLEKAAMEQILEAYPDLASVPLWEQSPRKNESYGRSWTNDFQTLCTSGDGYDLYGVFCKNGHVAGLRVTGFWGNTKNTDFPAVKDLIYLKNFTLSDTYPDVPNSFFEPLLNSILENLAIEHLVLPTSINFTASQPSALQYLSTFNSEFLSYSNFTNLRVYHLEDDSNNPQMDWTQFHPNLEEIRLYGSFDISQLLGNLSNFPSLKVVSCRWCVASNPTMQLTTSLQTLDISCDDYDSIVSMEIVSNTLETLYICTSSVNLTTPNLKHIQSGQIIGTPSLPQLQSLSIYAAEPVSNTMDQYICDFANQSTVGLAELYITYINQTFVSIPPCFRDSNILKYLYLAQVIFDPSTLENIPSTITSLELININSSLTMSQFEKLPYLSYLTITDYGGDSLTGEIPENFFQVMPYLTSLQLYSTGLSGTIPWYGWYRLESLDIFGNFEAWPGIDAAPRLEYLSISSNMMTIIPSEELFRSADLSSLVTFKVNHEFEGMFRGALTGPMPAFWTSLPYIRHVYLAGNFSGALPSPLACPRLESFDFFSFEKTCGGLPEIAVPMALRDVVWSDTPLQGSIPNSWAENLTIIRQLDLSHTTINGTLPANFLDHHTLQLDYVDLSSTYMFGALWNFSTSITLDQIVLAGTNFNVCEPIPSFPAGYRLSYCDLDRVPECPSSTCLNAWNSICEQLEPCTPVLHIGAFPSCVVPLPRPTVRLTYPPPCPLPAPEGFICDQGHWMWPISFSTPSITIPGGLGVIYIHGNLTVPGEIHFNGEGTTLEVSDCVNGVEQVLLTVNPDSKPFNQDLIRQKGSGCRDLSTVPIQVISSKKSCKEPRLSSSDSTRASLTVAFTLNKSKCNTKWIIIGCVLGALAVIGIVVAIVIIRKRCHSERSERRKLLM